MAGSNKAYVNNSPPSRDADDLNGSQNELNNLIVGSGQSLNIGDNQQTQKAVSAYAAGGAYYIDSGAANAYVLSPVGAKVTPAAYADGMVFDYLAANANTGPSTAAVGTLGIKNIFLNGAALTGGEILDDETTRIRVDAANDRFNLEPGVKSMRGSSKGNIMRAIQIQITGEGGASIQAQAALIFNSTGHIDTTQTSAGGITKGGGGETEGSGATEVTYTLDATGSTLTIDLAEAITNIISLDLFDNSMTTAIVGSISVAGGNMALHISDLVGANFDLTGAGSSKIHTWRITYMVGGAL